MPYIQEQVAPELIDGLMPKIRDEVAPQLIEALMPRIEEQIAPQLIDALMPKIRDQIAPDLVDALMPRIRDEMAPQLVDALMPKITDEVAPQLLDSLMPRIRDEIAPQLVDALMPKITDEVAPQLVDSLMPKIRTEVVPLILDDIVDDPAVRDLIREQSQGLFLDAIEGFRGTLADADNLTERVVRRVFRRPPRPKPESGLQLVLAEESEEDTKPLRLAVEDLATQRALWRAMPVPPAPPGRSYMYAGAATRLLGAGDRPRRRRVHHGPGAGHDRQPARLALRDPAPMADRRPVPDRRCAPSPSTCRCATGPWDGPSAWRLSGSGCALRTGAGRLSYDRSCAHGWACWGSSSGC